MHSDAVIRCDTLHRLCYVNATFGLAIKWHEDRSPRQLNRARRGRGREWFGCDACKQSGFEHALQGPRRVIAIPFKDVAIA